MHTLQQFSSWLKRFITDLPPGTKLPSVRALAHTFSLSPTTIQRIMRDYKKAGSVVSVKGKGSFTKQDSPKAAPEIAPPASSVDNAAQQIERMIFDGRLKRGQAIPSVKAFSIQQRVSPNTVVAAYKKLKQAGRIEKTGKEFRVAPILRPSFRSARQYVYLFSENAASKHASLGLLHEAYDDLEQELSAHGVTLRFSHIKEFDLLARKWNARDNYPRGILFWNVSAPMLGSLKAGIDTMRWKAQHSAPAILAIGGAPKGKPLLAHAPDIIHIAPGSIHTIQARMIADFVIERTYRHVYLFFDESREYAGGFMFLMRIWPEIKHRNPRIEVKYMVCPRTAAGGKQRFFERVQQARKHIGQHYKELFSYKLHAQERQRFEDMAADVTVSRKPSWESCARPSLWIFSDPHIVHGAREWAAKNRIHTPGEISLLSIGDHESYISKGISACIVDWHTIGYQMAHALLRDHPVARTSRGFLRLQTRIIERLSTP